MLQTTGHKLCTLTLNDLMKLNSFDQHFNFRLKLIPLKYINKYISFVFKFLNSHTKQI